AGSPRRPGRGTSEPVAGWPGSHVRCPALQDVDAGMAHLLNGSPDGAAAEVEPVLALPPGMRVATVTAYTERLRRRLEHPRYDGAAGVRDLADRLARFNAD